MGRAMQHLVIIWENEKGLQKARITPGKTYYIGRPRSQHLLKHPNMDPAEVYIIPEDGEEPIPTGITTLLVSRLDTKITIDTRGDTITLKNHGPTGHGAKNPTYVNGKLLPPGETITINLKTTPTIILQLTSVGPTFIITREEEKSLLLSIPAGIPVVLPAEIASHLEKTGLVKEQINWEGEGRPTAKYVVLNEHPGKQLIEIRERIEEIYQFMKILAQPEKEENKIIELIRLLETLYRAIDQTPKEAEKLTIKLKMTHYKELLKQHSKQAYNKYQQLIFLIEYTPHEKTQIKQEIDELIRILET